MLWSLGAGINLWTQGATTEYSWFRRGAMKPIIAFAGVGSWSWGAVVGPWIRGAIVAGVDSRGAVKAVAGVGWWTWGAAVGLRMQGAAIVIGIKGAAKGIGWWTRGAAIVTKIKGASKAVAGVGWRTWGAVVGLWMRDAAIAMGIKGTTIAIAVEVGWWTWSTAVGLWSAGVDSWTWGAVYWSSVFYLSRAVEPYVPVESKMVLRCATWGKYGSTYFTRWIQALYILERVVRAHLCAYLVLCVYIYYLQIYLHYIWYGDTYCD